MWVNNRVVICSTGNCSVSCYLLELVASVLHQVNGYLLRTLEVSTSPLT